MRHVRSFPRCLCFLACLLACLIGGSAHGDEAAEQELETRRAVIQSWRAEQLRALLTKSVGKTDIVFAGRVLRDLRRVQSDAEDLPALTKQVEALEEDGSKARKARAGLRKARAKYGKAAAGKLAALAKWSAGAELAEASRALAQEAVGLDPDNKPARALLGQVQVKRWGWVPSADAAQLKKGQVPVGDGWIPKKTAKAQTRSFETPLVMRSAHWEIHSNLDLDRLFELRDLLEAFHARFLDDWDGFVPIRDRKERHQVRIFDTKARYEGWIRKDDPNHLKGVPGQYSPARGYAAFYDVEAAAAGGQRNSSMAELMLHECTHQLMHELLASHFAYFEGQGSPTFWLHEGLCEYYGMHTLKRRDLVLDRKAISKMVRVAHLKKNASSLMTVTEMDTILKTQYLGSDMRARATRYAQSGFFCMLLMDKHRPAFRRLLRTAYCEENRAEMIKEFIGADLGALDKALRALIRSL